jgi:hypothetical protein
VPSGDHQQDAMSAIFANVEFDSDSPDDSNPVVTEGVVQDPMSDIESESKNGAAKTYSPSEELTGEDMLEVNIVQLNSGDEDDSVEYPVDFEVDEIDEDLISTMLESKNIDPAA